MSDSKSDAGRAGLDPSRQNTLLGAENAPYIEYLYEQYLTDPSSVTQKWREYFASVGTGSDTAHGPIREALAQRARETRNGVAAPATAPTATPDGAVKQAAVARLVQVYSNRGHLIADIDPLGLMRRPVPEVLELKHFGLSNADLDTEFYTNSRTDAIAKRMKPFRSFSAEGTSPPPADAGTGSAGAIAEAVARAAINRKHIRIMPQASVGRGESQ